MNEEQNKKELNRICEEYEEERKKYEEARKKYEEARKKMEEKSKEFFDIAYSVACHKS